MTSLPLRVIDTGANDSPGPALLAAGNEAPGWVTLTDGGLAVGALTSVLDLFHMP